MVFPLFPTAASRGPKEDPVKRSAKCALVALAMCVADVSALFPAAAGEAPKRKCVPGQTYTFVLDTTAAPGVADPNWKQIFPLPHATAYGKNIYPGWTNPAPATW